MNGRFNPLDAVLAAFVSACMSLLFGAVALAFAVAILQQIWLWLAIGFGVVAGLTILIQGWTWWRRRQSW